MQNFCTLKFTRKIYNGVPAHTGVSAVLTPRSCSSLAVTALQARTFAVWTLTSAVVRAYAAYNINNKMSVLFVFQYASLTPS